MKRNAHISTFLVLTLAALGGCSSKPPASETKKAGPTLTKIQGKIQVLLEERGTGDSVLNAGGPAVCLLDGKRRYRLFSRKIADVEPGKEYVAEGIVAQKVVDEIGDPDQGKGGYPLMTSCTRAVKMAWTNLPFDEVDLKASALRGRLMRYPARPIFLVVRIRPATEEESAAAAAETKKNAEDYDKTIPTINVPADKQKTQLVEGNPVQPAPLWEPKGGTVKCKIIIGPKGKISELDTGNQLCEGFNWDMFKYQPPTQGGKPVYVRTEVEVTYEPRK